MDATALTTVAGGVLFAVLAASVASWLWIANRWWRGIELLDYEPRRSVHWGGWQLLALFIAYLLLQVGIGRVALDWTRTNSHDPEASAAVPLDPTDKLQKTAEQPAAEAGDEHNEADRQMTMPEMQAVLLANAVVNALFGLAVIAVLRLGGAGASWADLGLPLTHLAYDIRAGLIAFFAASVPVHLLNAALSVFWKGEHPIVNFLNETSEFAGVLIATCAAVAVAPLVEELLFRGVLQGWLESNEPVGAPEANDTGRTPIAWRPIIVSSAIFALLHFGHGPAPIPLFVLALVLGYLFQRTHRIWPSVTVHFLFNLSSLLALAVNLSRRAVP